jgi:hypothetical protein
LEGRDNFKSLRYLIQTYIVRKSLGGIQHQFLAVILPLCLKGPKKAMFTAYCMVSSRIITGLDLTGGSLAIFAKALRMAEFGASWSIKIKGTLSPSCPSG